AALIQNSFVLCALRVCPPRQGRPTVLVGAAGRTAQIYNLLVLAARSVCPARQAGPTPISSLFVSGTGRSSQLPAPLPRTYHRRLSMQLRCRRGRTYRSTLTPDRERM